jgi:hypothetical protein
MTSVHPDDHMFTVLVQFGEEGDEAPYPLLVEMPYDTAEGLRKDLEFWVPLLRAKIDNRSSGGKVND